MFGLFQVTFVVKATKFYICEYLECFRSTFWGQRDKISHLQISVNASRVIPGLAATTHMYHNHSSCHHPPKYTPQYHHTHVPMLRPQYHSSCHHSGSHPQKVSLHAAQNSQHIQIFFSGTNVVMSSWPKPFVIQPRLFVALNNRAACPFLDFFVSPVICSDCALIRLNFLGIASFTS